MTSELGTRIARNSFYNAARAVLSIPLSLAVVAYSLHRVGATGYGIWALAGILASLVQVFDLGLTDGVARVVAHHRALGNDERINECANTGLVLIAGFGALLSAATYLLLPQIVERVLAIPAPLAGTAREIMAIALGCFLLGLLGNIFTAVLNGVQEMGYANLVGLASAVGTAAFTIALVHEGMGVHGLAWGALAGSAISVAGGWIAARRVLPALRLRPGRWVSRAMARELVDFGWKANLSAISNVVALQIDRVLLSHYVGLGSVTSYDVASRLVLSVRGLATSVFAPLLPAAAGFAAAKDREALAGLYRRALKYLLVLAGPTAVLGVLFARSFVTAWLGPGHEDTALAIQILLAVHMLNLLTAPGHFILSGMNRPGISTAVAVATTALNVAVCWILVQSSGFRGVLVGVASVVGVMTIVFLTAAHLSIPGLRWRPYATLAASLCVPVVPLAAGLWLLDRWMPLSGFAPLALVGTGFAAIVGLYVLRSGYLDEFDRGLLRSLVPAALRPRTPAEPE